MAVYLQLLEVNEFKSFAGNNIFNMAHEENNNPVYFTLPQCTIFLGDNGTGKTNLLKVIANLQPERVVIKDVKSDASNTDSATIYDFNFSSEVAISDADNNKETIRQICYRPKVIERHKADEYSVYSRFVISNNDVHKINEHKFKQLASISQSNNVAVIRPYRIGYAQNCNFVEYDTPALNEAVIYGYGVNRFADTQRNLGSDSTTDTLFFNSKPLLNFEEWLLQLDMASKDETQGQKAQNRIRQIKKILCDSDILPGVKDYSLYVDEQLHTSILFETEYGRLRYQELGYGYQCMMAWIFDFIKKMFDRYPDSDNPLHEPAILVIDEIDLHLHPHWQRHVLRDLCRLFPATQIIASTHSPLVIQSVSSMNLFLLTNEAGKTKVTEYPARTFQGWTVEEILHELMCLSPDTRADEYKELRERFETAMNNNDITEGLKCYRKLKAMLHPESLETDLLDMDINQLKASNS